MAYTITDIAELVEYHLVASAPDDDAAHSNLVQLVQQLELMAPRPLWREATWVFWLCLAGLAFDSMLPRGLPFRDRLLVLTDELRVALPPEPEVDAEEGTDVPVT